MNHSPKDLPLQNLSLQGLSLQVLSLSKLYENATLEEKTKLLTGLMGSMKIEDILYQPVIMNKIKESITETVVSKLGNNTRANMISICLKQMDDNECLWSFFSNTQGLKDCVKYQYPNHWINYYMDGESMVVLSKYNTTDKEVFPFDFQRDIIDSKYNTSKLKKLVIGDVDNITMWCSW